MTVLDDLARSVRGRLAHAALAVGRADETQVFGISAAPDAPPMGPDAPIRVASISKVVTGQVVRAAAAPGATVDVAGRRIALDALLGHVSGLRDGAGLVPADGRSPVQMAGDAEWGPPVFDYCNLGYALAADAVLGAGFGEAASAWLAAWGIEGGFNWSGVPDEAWARAVPCLRRTDRSFVAQIDGAGPAPAPKAAGAGAFSPQGGLRTSLRGCLALARAIPAMDRTVLHDPGPARPTDLFDRYGPGLMILRRPAFYPRALIGHFANAYGLCGGIWHDAEAGLSFAYLLNGLPEGDEDDALRPVEREIFGAMAAIAVGGGGKLA
ncbi:serine hydrolase [Jannaschia aquimarina]|uniref:Beta-lactamase n=1 Tax=Jannaschia aquimarina TaxID=935700 RepID=A0A0D1D466_9RHOB|nr:serine hydrolase domain-containing protein [Jannaschia aquimarina]KIT14833.1 Beta-lactamase [Jannaschia aquimarina]SNS57156.1 CubicO group peptidase, beta-lactamase class C family [Jannaschia aquimarina]